MLCSFHVLPSFIYLFICLFSFFSFFFVEGAPASQIKNDILPARQACQVISCAIVGGVIHSDGHWLFLPFSGRTACLQHVTASTLFEEAAMLHPLINWKNTFALCLDHTTTFLSRGCGGVAFSPTKYRGSWFTILKINLMFGFVTVLPQSIEQHSNNNQTWLDRQEITSSKQKYILCCNYIFQNLHCYFTCHPQQLCDMCVCFVFNLKISPVEGECGVSVVTLMYKYCVISWKHSEHWFFVV